MNVAHQMTDNLLIQLEQRINSEYSQAAREIEDKMNAYLSRMEDKYADKLELVRNGQMTPAELSTWFNNQLLVGNRWAEMRDTLAQDLTNTNQIAASMINGHTPEVYALNHNYGTFEVEEQSQINTSYTLYDRWTVERLLRDDPDLTPNMAPEARINVPLDQRWNRRQINSAITQGVLQGESIPAIARRLENVTNMNRTSAIRNARTMTTSAECGGRIDSYIRAENMGIEMKQAWIATHDSRTRFSHAQMDGETAVVGEKFSNGCKFPGDPEGKPEEVYNCRCTIIGIVEGSTLSDDMLARREYWDNDARYQEWVRRHEENATQAIGGGIADQIRNASSVQQINDILNNNGLFAKGVANLDGCDIESARAVARAYNQVFERFPQLIGRFDAPNAQPGRKIKNAYAWCYTRYGGRVEVNPKYFNNYAQLVASHENDLLHGWTPQGTTVDSIVAHEIGHSVDGLLSSLGIGGGRPARVNEEGRFEQFRYTSSAMRSSVMRSCGYTTSDINAQVSGYATSNPQEWFAECFSEYMTSSNPRPVAAEFGRRVDEMIGGLDQL